MGHRHGRDAGASRIMARPTKLTPEVHAAIVEAVSIGATYKDAAGAAGVSYVTFLNWMKRGGKATRGEFFEFFSAIETTKHQLHARLASVIVKAAANGDYRAADLYLTKRDKENWGNSINVTTEEREVNDAISRLLENVAAAGKAQTAKEITAGSADPDADD